VVVLGVFVTAAKVTTIEGMALIDDDDDPATARPNSHHEIHMMIRGSIVAAVIVADAVVAV